MSQEPSRLRAGTIVTLGGGGFSMSEDGRSAIDDLLLELSGATNPRVCFVPTASGDDPGYCKRFLDAFGSRARTTVLSLFGRDDPGYADPRLLMDQDVIYVGGGSTANLLAVWRVHGLPEILRAAAANGTVLAGISAGMNCWFDASSTDSFGALAPLSDGLGFLPGSACPHLDGEEGRREKFVGWVGDGSLPPGYGVDDHTALVWRDGRLTEAVCERPDRPAIRLERTENGVQQHDLEVRLLT